MPLGAEKPTARILVVDDNEANRLLARNTLEDEGYEVILATGGAEGIDAFQKERPDCVLLDVRMPDIDGFAVCERIRVLAHGSETPVLFLTALRDVDTFDRALRAGGDDFLTKPIRPTELVVRVQSALKLRRLRVELREAKQVVDHEGLAARASRYGHRYCAALCDIDKFKDYNDCFGHLAGDEALRQIASCSSATLERIAGAIPRRR